MTARMQGWEVEYELERLADFGEERSRLDGAVRRTVGARRTEAEGAGGCREGGASVALVGGASATAIGRFNELVAGISDVQPLKVPAQTAHQEQGKRVRFDESVSYRDDPGTPETAREAVEAESRTETVPATATAAPSPPHFAPYHDFRPPPNAELFAQQQQELATQDRALGHLATRVTNAHSISAEINDEVTDQNRYVLDDLEGLVQNTGRNLSRAKRRLAAVEHATRENAPCAVILVLLLILILLLLL
ncbi:syntaxin KNAG_0D04830 [Huiozyma naganishii CBS 8797]|uniref:t-SNARE coiled-coil homology domain-containing protein n=1 Tax=Huiozyma naganishii (strain ATCC MYA-139 / BCRC 22969 / CBS 8797 / KCTC 17520 / NBRC 10181 / NCYC 3082 / Yp74L-3) TaxID=1071383 RepID=J7RYI0_HUIN7|nr:hypothetical protein KNAG_0D04830 [Kazachstania naganishii CBS 8797]CCK70222.1 hypothetical protein KNAG_0D04830 [Kazachstania naganishii CBS 8797]